MVKDPISKLRTATRRAKSDVANKLISMCLHEMSRRVSKNWPLKVDGEEYGNLVRECFRNECPYCSRELTIPDSVIEHLDGLNRYRVGLHVPGNVLVRVENATAKNVETTRYKCFRLRRPAGSLSCLMTEPTAPRHAFAYTGRAYGRMKRSAKPDCAGTWVGSVLFATRS